jgi:hypothetical protein
VSTLYARSICTNCFSASDRRVVYVCLSGCNEDASFRYAARISSAEALLVSKPRANCASPLPNEGRNANYLSMFRAA